MSFDYKKIRRPEGVISTAEIATNAKKVLAMTPNELEAIPEEERISIAFGLICPPDSKMSLTYSPWMVYAALAQIFFTYKPDPSVVAGFLAPLRNWKQTHLKRLSSDKASLWLGCANTAEIIEKRVSLAGSYINEWTKLYPGLPPIDTLRLINSLDGGKRGYNPGTGANACFLQVVENDYTVVKKEIVCTLAMFEEVGTHDVSYKSLRADGKESMKDGKVSSFGKHLMILIHEFAHYFHHYLGLGRNIRPELQTVMNVSSWQLEREGIWAFTSWYASKMGKNHFQKTIGQFAYEVDPLELFNKGIESHADYPFPARGNETLPLFGSR